MAYNKAREEKKWRLWKEAEEKQLRSLGGSEDTIEQLRVHDWAIFNSDRRYYQHMQETGTYLDEVATDTTPPEIKTVDDFLDNIENQKLYQVLIKVDRLTFLKKDGTPKVAANYEGMLKGLVKKYNKLHKDQLPNITPHILRHTFCTRLANAGMNPKALQYIMGHANITMTLNYYAHATYDSAKAEMERLAA